MRITGVIKWVDYDRTPCQFPSGPGDAINVHFKLATGKSEIDCYMFIPDTPENEKFLDTMHGSMLTIKFDENGDNE